MEKRALFAAEIVGYGLTGLFAFCAVMAALDNWGDKIFDSKTHFYQTVYEFTLQQEPPDHMLNQHALNGRVGVFSTFGGLSFSFARWMRSIRTKIQ